MRERVTFLLAKHLFLSRNGKIILHRSRVVSFWDYEPGVLGSNPGCGGQTGMPLGKGYVIAQDVLVYTGVMNK